VGAVDRLSCGSRFHSSLFRHSCLEELVQGLIQQRPPALLSSRPGESKDCHSERRLYHDLVLPTRDIFSNLSDGFGIRTSHCITSHIIGGQYAQDGGHSFLANSLNKARFHVALNFQRRSSIKSCRPGARRMMKWSCWNCGG
jgi:hypothetical protein